MEATKTLEAMMTAIAAGKTVHVQTYMHTTKVDAKVVSRFAKIDRPVFKALGNSLYMTSGKRYVCIDFCRVTAV